MSNPQTETYTLICILEGEKSPFPIEIANNKVVGLLKEAIKEKNPNALAKIDARSLVLYHIDAQGPTLRDKINVANMKMQHLSPDDALDPTVPLSIIFCSAPSSGEIHILVQLPPGGVSFYREPSDVLADRRLYHLAFATSISGVILIHIRISR
ncbi:hypothetical protein CPB86DRAFT_787051, partial [Serendipita vermifera]